MVEEQLVPTPDTVTETNEELRQDGGVEAMAARIKNWDELSMEEKLERARQVIHALEEEVRMLRKGHDKLNWQFRKHSHDANGVVTLPLDEAEQMLYSGMIPGSVMNGLHAAGSESKYF